MNPIPYQADYFGHKLHIDQNEKCVMYGVTHICGFITMPVENNISKIILMDMWSNNCHCSAQLLSSMASGIKSGLIKEKNGF